MAGYGIPKTPEALAASAIRRYNERVVRGPDCWDWTGTFDAKGYPKMGIGVQTSLLMHRFSYQHHRGPIPPGKWVLHTCDNSHCTNPEHLYIGTVKENNRDRWERTGLRKAG